MLPPSRLIPQDLDLRTQRERLGLIGAAPQIQIGADAGVGPEMRLIGSKARGVAQDSESQPEIRSHYPVAIEYGERIQCRVVRIEVSGSVAVVEARALGVQLEIEVLVDLATERKPEEPVLVLERAPIVRRDAADLGCYIPVVRLTRRSDGGRDESGD
jgi:hypothetical protein